MPNHKKRKLNTNSQFYSQKSRQQTTDDTSLSHAEIWDDSALIRSWNDAYAEYEYYHSIHARGEDVDEVLRRAEMEDAVSKEGSREPADGQDEYDEGEVVDGDEHDGEDGEVINDGEGEVPAVNGHVKQNGTETTSGTEQIVNGEDGLLTAEAGQGMNLQPVQPALSEGTSAQIPATAMADQTLENIKMAYYWAGYYSGLYDGQRQQQASTSS